MHKKEFDELLDGFVDIYPHAFQRLQTLHYTTQRHAYTLVFGRDVPVALKPTGTILPTGNADRAKQ
jgi:hypothetical protein